MERRPAVELTEDGSATVRSPLHGDTYHSTRGAIGEARHVFIEAGWREWLHGKVGGKEIIATGPLRIFEAGFGTGLNAWLTLMAAQEAGRRVEYTTVELYPLPEDVAATLNYTDDGRFMAMHRALWNKRADIDERFRLLKLHGDATKILKEGIREANGSRNRDCLPTVDDRRHDAAEENYDIIYWDAFAPDTQPELWTAEIFSHVFAVTAPGGILVTYSAKGDVKRALGQAGFTVERIEGALGKRHMLRARKTNNG